MRVRLAKLLVRLVRLLVDDGDHIVYLNTELREGPPGEVRAFVTYKETPDLSTVISFPKDDAKPVMGTPVPESVAIAAGLPVRRIHEPHPHGHLSGEAARAAWRARSGIHAPR